MKVASFNCMGDMKNPFEFYNDFFETNFLSYANEMMKYKCHMTENKSIYLSEIDKDYTRQYSLYGVNYKQYIKDMFDPLFTLLKFKQQWYMYNNDIPDSSDWKININEKQNSIFSFDLELFQILRTSVYVCSSDLQKTLESFDAYFKIYAAKKTNIIQKVMEANADVICLQEFVPDVYSHMKLESMYNIHWDTNKKLCILFRQCPDFVEFLTIPSNFKMIGSVFPNFIIFNAHIKSTNFHLIYSYLEYIVDLQKTTQTSIILCIDTNAKPSQLSELIKATQEVNMFHINEDFISTCCKKRSYLQTQFHKADILDDSCKDFIFLNSNKSHLAMSNFKVEPAESILLPSQNHLSDHKLISCNIFT